MRARPLAVAALAASALAQASCQSPALPLVRAHASYDLGCPDEEIRVEEQLGGQFKAIGCGRKARYRAACDGLRCAVQSEDATVIPWRDRPEPTERPR